MEPHQMGQPASRDQIVAIIRQRAQRNLDQHNQHMQHMVRARVLPGLALMQPEPAGLMAARPPPPYHFQPPMPMPADPMRYGMPARRVVVRLPGGHHAPPPMAPPIFAPYPFAAANAPRMALPPPPPGPRHLVRYSHVSSSASEDEDPAVGFPGEGCRMLNVVLEGNTIAYAAASEDQVGLAGVFIGPRPLTDSQPYFEIEITDKGDSAAASSAPLGIVVGLCSKNYPLDILPGWTSESVGYSAGDGSVFRGRPRGQLFGKRAEVGDKIGCGIRPAPGVLGKAGPEAPAIVTVFFTHNGREVSGGPPLVVAVPHGGFFPAVGLQNPGEEVVFWQSARWSPDDLMLVDGTEEEWMRLHDIRLNGQVLEYMGRGKSMVDVGLAQAKNPVCTRNHYFEIEIVDPGNNCYIAIGLARKDYPKNRHPGWNKGSVAYHADDGKVFVGSGVGAPFGPRCHKGDVMGCGVLFPRNYESKSDSEEEIEQQGGGGGGGGLGVAGGALRQAALIGLDPDQVEDLASDSGEDDDWWNDQGFVQSGVKVQIFFTRNGKVIGKRDVRIPKGGFFPTIGMMSCQEKVRVDLHPLSG